MQQKYRRHLTKPPNAGFHAQCRYTIPGNQNTKRHSTASISSTRDLLLRWRQRNVCPRAWGHCLGLWTCRWCPSLLRCGQRSGPSAGSWQSESVHYLSFERIGLVAPGPSSGSSYRLQRKAGTFLQDGRPKTVPNCHDRSWRINWR